MQRLSGIARFALGAQLALVAVAQARHDKTVIQGSTFDLALPQSIRADVLAAMRGVPFDEASLKRHPSALHLSGAVMKKNRYMINRIHFFEGKRFDIWHSRHSTQAGDLDFASWDYFSIVVDKNVTPKKAYYLQFQPQAVKRGAIPRLEEHRVACYQCHSGGPLAIRPAKSAEFPVDSAMRKRIDEWNRRIAGYGVVEAHVPELSRQALSPEGEHLLEPLRHQACVSCHSVSDGLRAPLLRLHHIMIRGLTHHSLSPDGFFVSDSGQTQTIMPPGVARLPESEIACIEDWLSRDRVSQPRQGCNERGEAIAKDRARFVVDSVGSAIRASVRSSIVEIEVTQTPLTGMLDCLNVGFLRCAGELRADLRGAVTGIALRDQHLKEMLGADREPFVVATLAPFPFAAAGETVDLGVSMRIAGKSAEYAAKLTCRENGQERRCTLEPLPLALERHGIDVPSYLGVSVESRVTVTGEIVFREASTDRATASTGALSTDILITGH